MTGTTPILAAFGREFSDLIDGLHFAVVFGPMRDGINNGAGPFIDQLQTFLDKASTDLHTLGADILPAARSSAAAIRTVDVGRLLDNALAATASGNSIAVHIHPPGR